MTTQPEKFNWIWPCKYADTVNQYIRFRHAFNLDSEVRDGKLLISCEGNFAAFINGHFVATGQFHDYPDKPTYSQVDVSEYLQEGENELQILGYHFGINHFSHIQSDASLWYILNCNEKIISCGIDTEYQVDPAYKNGELERITPQLGYVFEYDASKKNTQWHKIQKTDIVDRPAPIPRPLPMPELKPPAQNNIISSGSFIRKKTNKKNCTFGQLMQSDYISPELNSGDGRYMIIDMGREECGFISLDVDASASTVLDIAVGQHLEGGRVCAYVGGRNFASRYICSDGRQTFTHYNNRYSGRYIQLHISSEIDHAKIHYVGLIPHEYPLKFPGRFSCNDSLAGKIYETCARTLHLCMHEHYEDTPWREQALYANDARNQALTGYCVFGEYEFPKISFDLLAQGIRPDCFLPLSAPSIAVDFTIPSFTFAWVEAMRELLMYSGDKGFLKTKLPLIRMIIDSLIKRCKNDLLPCPEGRAYWHFYDWEEGLDGVDGSVGDWQWLEVKTERFDAPLNMYFASAIQAVSEICYHLGEKKQSAIYIEQFEKTKQNIHNLFWVEHKQAYQTYIGKQGIQEHFCELVQALAASINLKPDKMRDHLADKQNNMVKASLSQSLLKYKTLFTGNEHHVRFAYNEIMKKWSDMLYNGATSFWETSKGASDFENAGSLCHGWSAVPAWFFSAFILGVQPLEPGFKKFKVSPVTGIAERTTGTVMTPHGPINVQRKGKEIIVSCPEGLVYEVETHC